jgi:hypothetical protein
MPEKVTIERARRDLRAGKRPSTAAGEFVREEIEHVRRGKHGARSTKQLIAIGLSEARRAGVPLEPAPARRSSQRTRVAAKRALAVGRGKRKAKTPSRRRRQAATHALRREGRAAASKRALSAQARSTARRRHRRARGS